MSVASLLTAPRVPKRSPVHVTIARTQNDWSGTGRALAIVTGPDGYVVEVLEDDGTDLERVRKRWPWLSTQGVGWFGLGAQAWPLVVYVRPAEYRRLLKLEPFGETAARLRRLGDRCERFSRVVAALNALHVDGGRPDRQGAAIYHRPAEQDPHGPAVRALMRALVAEGMATRDDAPGTVPGDICGIYRTTATTPAYR